MLRKRPEAEGQSEELKHSQGVTFPLAGEFRGICFFLGPFFFLASFCGS